MTCRVVGFLCLFLFQCIADATPLDSLDCQKQQCLAVVDAGSTGSRLHVFTYSLDAQHSPINVTEQWSKKVKPGFAELNSQEAVGAYLSQLFSSLPNQQIPVYFYATGGMRLLPQPSQQKLYGFLTHWFNEQRSFRLLGAQTLTGRQEGFYGWLAVNYQLGKLTDPKQSLVGMMDTGGASVQIAFPLSETVRADDSDVVTFSRYGRHVKLFVHSFLGIGQNGVEHQFLDTSACFANNYLLPDGQKAQGDARVCVQEVAELLNRVHHVNTLVSTLVREARVQQWYVLGGLMYMVRSQTFNFQDGSFTSADMLEKGDSGVCHQDWSTLTTQYPGDSYLYSYCLFPAYYYALLVDGYGVSPETPLHYLTSNADSDWTMGVVLMQ